MRRDPFEFRVDRRSSREDSTERNSFGILCGRDDAGARMQYLVIEHFRNGDARPVYRRFREQGRLAPEGLRYVASWVTEDLTRCYQVMECDDRAPLDQWIARWSDLVEFEIHPVVSSAEAAARAASKL